METALWKDFKEFLNLLNSHGVRYLLVGGHAVGYHGYPRATGDLDVWIAVDPDNAARTVDAIREFGFDTPELTPTVLLQNRSMLRMGEPPIRIAVLTALSGVDFEACYAGRVEAVMDGTEVTLINLRDLKANKRASGRPKDLADLAYLPK